DATIINLASNLVAQRKPNEAISTLKHAATLSTSPAVRKRLADAYAIAGRLDEAIYEYQEVLKLDPKYIPAMNDMGRALISRYRGGMELDEEMRQLAVRYWRASLTLNPE